MNGALAGDRLPNRSNACGFVSVYRERGLLQSIQISTAKDVPQPSMLRRVRTFPCPARRGGYSRRQSIASIADGSRGHEQAVEVQARIRLCACAMGRYLQHRVREVRRGLRLKRLRGPESPGRVQQQCACSRQAHSCGPQKATAVAPALTRRGGDELDWYADWSLNKNLILSVVAAWAQPSKGIEQAYRQNSGSYLPQWHPRQLRRDDSRA